MFNITGVLGHLMRAKQPTLSPMRQYLAELATGHVSDRTRRELTEWDKQEREAIRRSMDELAAQMPQNSDEPKDQAPQV